jgi:flagellar biosynthetic protein FliR
MKTDLTWLLVFGLVMVRVSGLLLVAPVFAGLYIPIKIRVFTTLVLSLLLCGPLTQQGIPAVRMDMLPVTLALELLVGLLIGLAFRWTMFGVAVAGEVIGLQMGLGIASVIDPASGMQSNFVQTLFLMIYSVIFLALDGHHEMLRAFVASYRILPPGPQHLDLSCLLELANQTMALLVVGIRLSGTLLIPLAMMMCAMALISRAFPQANVFFLSYSVSLLLGLFLLSTTGPALRLAVEHGIRQGTRDALLWVQGLAGLL